MFTLMGIDHARPASSLHRYRKSQSVIAFFSADQILLKLKKKLEKEVFYLENKLFLSILQY